MAARDRLDSIRRRLGRIVRSNDHVLASSPAFPPAPCLIRVIQQPDGRFTARVLGEPDLQATAATAEEAVEPLRGRFQEEVDWGRLFAIELPSRNPLMERFGYAKDDPEFEEYLEEIRKFREEEDRREGRYFGPDECSDTTLTPTI